ncbi:tRNA (guanine-N(7)-)-methyltransferase subunit TRM82, partial [Mytilus galloprovincialis]
PVPRRCTSLTFTKDEKYVLLSDKTGDAYRFSIDDETHAGELLLGHLSMVLDIVVARNDEFVVTCDRDEKIRVEAEKEFLVQTHSLVQKETEQLTKKLKNEANEILEEAQANSSKKITLAEADREVSLTSAYVHGLKYLYLTLGVNSEEHQLSLMMIRALEDSNVKGNLYRGYGYNTSTIVSSPFN